VKREDFSAVPVCLDKVETAGFATIMQFKCESTIHCQDSKLRRHVTIVAAERVSEAFDDGPKHAHATYTTNYHIVMMHHRIGTGMYHAEMMAGFLGIPSNNIYRMFRAVEDKLGVTVTNVANRSMEDALLME
jgi:hypothetical protein